MMNSSIMQLEHYTRKPQSRQPLVPRHGPGPYPVNRGGAVQRLSLPTPSDSQQKQDTDKIVALMGNKSVLVLSNGGTIVAMPFVLPYTISSTNRGIEPGSGITIDKIERAHQIQHEYLTKWNKGVFACQAFMSQNGGCVYLPRLLSCPEVQELWHLFTSLAMNPLSVPHSNTVLMTSHYVPSTMDVTYLAERLITINILFRNTCNEINMTGGSAAIDVISYLQLFIEIIRFNVATLCSNKCSIGGMYRRKLEALVAKCTLTLNDITPKVADLAVTVSTCASDFEGKEEGFMTDALNLNPVDAELRQRFMMEKRPYHASLAVYDLEIFYSFFELDQHFNRSRCFALKPKGKTAELESIRRLCVSRILDFCTAENLSEATLHTAIRIGNLLFYTEFVASKQFSKVSYYVSGSNDHIPCRTWICMGFISALRNAIKIHESIAVASDCLTHEKWDKYNIGVELSLVNREFDLALVKEWDVILVKLIGNTNAIPPTPLQFFDRLLTIGGWPTPLTKKYRESCQYILTRCVVAPHAEFDSTTLSGTSSLRIASAILAMCIKIKNKEGSLPAYETWPQRLSALTEFDYDKHLRDITVYISKILSTRVDDKLNRVLESRYGSCHIYS